MLLGMFPVFVMALSLSQPKAYPVIHNNKKYDVYEMGTNFGQLNDGTWVKLVCIKKGMIGMPNITMPSYRGQYINKQEERCYIFVAEPEGTITYKNQELKVYHMDNNKGFLSDGTQITIECLAPGAVAKIKSTPLYRGTYSIDATGDKNKKQQCHVYAIQDNGNVSSTGIRGLGTGFRS